MTPETRHYLLTRHVIETDHAPSVEQIAAQAEAGIPEVDQAFNELSAMRGVILVPNSKNIWSLHPFALVPTAFWVTAGGKGWWANCAWCSLAIGAALQQDVDIHTSDGAEGHPLHFSIHSGIATRPDLLMHFPEPPERWWDNPYCPCGNILFFSSTAKIDSWCQRHGRPRGAILEMPEAIGIAQRWFGDYASPDWRRKSPSQAVEIFTQLGLDPAFWQVAGVSPATS